MRRPVGVIIAAVLLLLTALFGTLIAVVGLAASIMGHHQQALPGPLHATMIFSAAIELCGFLFCGWTSIALFRLRPWARVAAIVIAGFACFSCFLGGIGILFLRSDPALMPATPHPSQVMAVLTGMAIFFLLLALISAWWLVYFSLAAARRAFAAPPATMDSAAPGAALDLSALPLEPRTPGSRIVLVVWSWLMLLSVVSIPTVLWMHMPMFFFGAILRGRAGTLTLLALWLAEMYMAVGLLRRWKPAWYLGVVFQIYAIGYTATLLLPSMRARFAAYMHEVMSRSSYGTVSPIDFFNGKFYAFCLVLGLMMVLVFSWALIQRRNDYLRA